MIDFNEFKQRLIALELVPEDMVIGCSDKQINTLMEMQQVEWLPDVYKEYLRVFGIYAEPALSGNAELIYYHQLLGIKDRIVERLENREQRLKNQEHFSFTMPDDAFLFSICDQLYYFHYFLTSTRSDNPIVYAFSTVDGPASLGPLEQYLEQFLSDAIEFAQEFKESDNLYYIKKIANARKWIEENVR